jgi:hypothetical protein
MKTVVMKRSDREEKAVADGAMAGALPNGR